jgi:hypothetical protein
MFHLDFLSPALWCAVYAGERPDLKSHVQPDRELLANGNPV